MKWARHHSRVDASGCGFVGIHVLLAASLPEPVDVVTKRRGEYIDPTRSRVTIGARGPQWLNRQTQHLQPSSCRPFEIAGRIHVDPVRKTVRVCDVQHSEVRDRVTLLGEGRSGTTASGRSVSCRRSSRSACGTADCWPARASASRRSTRPGEHVYLNHQQVQKLAGEAKGHELLVLVLAYTGLRWGEMAGLRVSDMDLRRRRLNVNQNAVEVGAEIIVGTPNTTPDAPCPTQRRCRSRCSPSAPTSCRPRCTSLVPTARTRDGQGRTGSLRDGSRGPSNELVSPASRLSNCATLRRPWRCSPERNSRCSRGCSVTSRRR